MEEEVNKEIELVPDQPEPSAEAEPQPDEFCSRKVYNELYDRYLRLQADFDNFRKRVEREKREHQVFATERLLTELLPILDHLELALRHSREAGPAQQSRHPSEDGGAFGGDPEPLIEGVAMILRQMESVLQKYGLQPVEALGKPFDPQVHEALMQVESADHPEQTVVVEHQRGYTLAGRTLRPSRVGVSRLPDPGEAKAP